MERLLDPDKFFGEVYYALALSFNAPVHAWLGYSESWRNEWAIENCGDRLWQILYGPRDIEPLPKSDKVDVPNFDGMTAREVFGLGHLFTRRELDRARRRLVKEFHPDRWHNASPGVLKSHEEALKHVNAAYDTLRAGIR